jgi:ABC-type sugar transport system substrate-binding protein
MFVFAEIPSPGPRTSLIVCPDAEIGRVAGEFVARSLRLKATEEGRAEPAGRVVELTIAPPDPVHAGYSDGFSKSLSQQPGISLVHQAPCNLLGEDVADRMNEVLRLHKDFEVIFAHNDLIARAASKAVATARPELAGRILVMGVDGNLGKGGGKEMIIKGEIDATICRPPLVDLAWALIEKCLGDPQFNPKARYDVAPLALNFESALEIAKTGLPMPPIE